MSAAHAVSSRAAPGALLPPAALWIGSAHPFDLHECYLDFRAPAVLLAAPPAHAELRITADSRYRLWVNGRCAGRGPARCYPLAQSVDCLDITAGLQAGPCTLAVQVYQPGYSHFSYVHRGAAGLLACLLIDGQPLLCTDTTWRVRRNPSFDPATPRVSIYGSGVEARDLRLDDGWAAPRYDDSGWSPARICALPGAAPWTGLEQRDVPLLVERDLPLTLVQARRGPGLAANLPAHEFHPALVEAWRTAEPAHAPPDADGWFAAGLEQGQAAAWLFDLGHAHACQGWAEVEGAEDGAQLYISYADKLRDGELVLSDPATYCRVRLTDRFVLRQGAQIAEPFALRGGRYLLFLIAGGGQLRLRFHARASEYPLEVQREYVAPDDELAAIVALCRRTFDACLQETFVDSAWRESSQWVGDALPQALIMATLTDDVRPLRRVLRMAAQGAYPDGMLPSVLPGEVHAYAIVDYNFMWVELLALYHRLTGDGALVQELWPALVQMLDRFAADVAPDGLIRSQPGRRLFLDWAPVSRNEPSAIYNLHYLLALQTAAGLAAAAQEHDADAATVQATWQARASALQKASRQAFYRQGRWWDDLAGTTFSQLAAALAVLTGAALAAECKAQLDAIAQRSLDLADEHTPGAMVLASPFMHHYLFEALHQAGRRAELVEIIRRRWGRWVRAGYPTAWENWNVDFPDGSQCHAFSAHPLYHLARDEKLQASRHAIHR